MSHADIILLPGDGIGPEVLAQSVRVLEKAAARGGHTLGFQERLMGGCSIDRQGVALSDEVLADCRAADAVLMGAVGGPKWDDPRAKARPEQGMLALRKGLEVFANLRPVKVRAALQDVSPIKPDRIAGVDFLVVRELTGGLYFGQPKERGKTADGHERAVDTLEYSDYEIRRVVEFAFRLAACRHRKVTSVDKANVLESSRLWRQVTVEVGAQHPEIALDHLLVDTASMRIIQSPRDFDVIVTDNMFGDILTDEASVLAGSMGMLPSASLGDGGPGLYEPIHGSAPDITGKGIANPVAAILSGAMLFRYSLGWEREAEAIERAVDYALDAGNRTADLQPAGKPLTTKEMTDCVLGGLE
ncbi:MAG: 3-isopropylmalate dehydrogenase [Anaerolineales bacterium]|nr:3-isopropylmalate dehydrogenase [Anaerolineales bacterium]